MHLPTRSSFLHFIRILQIVFALGLLVLIAYCGVHRTWWDNIDGPLALGVIAALFTFGFSTFSIISYYRNSSPLSGSTAKTVVRVSIEIVFFLIYVAVAGLMLRPKTGCVWDLKVSNQCDSPDDNTTNWQWDAAPFTEWGVGIAFSFVQIVSYILTSILVVMENRSGKVGGGASYA